MYGSDEAPRLFHGFPYVTYRIEKILLSPASVEISKEGPTLTQPDRRTLTPREADDSAPADATPTTQ